MTEGEYIDWYGAAAALMHKLKLLWIYFQYFAQCIIAIAVSFVRSCFSSSLTSGRCVCLTSIQISVTQLNDLVVFTLFSIYFVWFSHHTTTNIIIIDCSDIHITHISQIHLYVFINIIADLCLRSVFFWVFFLRIAVPACTHTYTWTLKHTHTHLHLRFNFRRLLRPTCTTINVISSFHFGLAFPFPFSTTTRYRCFSASPCISHCVCVRVL